MSIQDRYCVMFISMAVLQIICAVMVYKSNKPIRSFTSRLNLSITLTIIANIMIIKSSNVNLSYFSYYLSYIGMDLIMVSLVNYTNSYCKGVKEHKVDGKLLTAYFLIIVDIVQLLLGPVFNHVLAIETTMLDGRKFYRDVPYVGLTIHRIVDNANKCAWVNNRAYELLGLEECSLETVSHHLICLRICRLMY